MPATSPQTTATKPPIVSDGGSDPGNTSVPAQRSEAVPSDDVTWLFPLEEPTGFRLIGENRDRRAGCGPTDDCLGTVPASSLDYDSDDPAMRRTISIRQVVATEATLAGGPGFFGADTAIGGRSVFFSEDPAGPSGWFRAHWVERDRIVVSVDAFGIEREAFDRLIASLTAVSSAGWPGDDDVREPLGRCVDARSQIAPTFVPDGWNRVVIEAQPTGGCATSPFLFMSLVRPGTDDAQGQLVTIVTGPVWNSTPQPGEPIDVDGVDGTLQPGAIDFRVDTVRVDVHGDVPAETLLRIAQGMKPVSDAQWAALVASVDAEQGTP